MFLEGRLKTTELQLSGLNKLLAEPEADQETTAPSPWNSWDIAMFAGCVAGIAALILFGVLNISFNLLESGFVTFRQNPWRAYLWAALLPVGALAVKLGWDFLQDRKRREIYTWVCLSLGLAGVLVWICAYACVYPTLSKGINEQIANLTVFDNSSAGTGTGLNFAGTKWIDAITVGAQAMAEIFLSALLGIYLTKLYARHRPVRLAQDPMFRQIEEERRQVLNELSRERQALAHATGTIAQLENQLSALVAYGKSILHRESARRKEETDRREVILNELSDRIRDHIQTAPVNPRLGLAATSTAQNGR